MDFFETANSRFTYRGKFTKDKLSKEEIEKILIAGLSAPKGNNIQTTTYVAVDDEVLIEEIGKIVPRDNVVTAPFILVVLTEDKRRVPDGANFELENVSAAVTTLSLAASALGYASAWLDYAMNDEATQEAVKKLLTVPAHKKIYCLLPMGKTADEYELREKLTIAETVEFNTCK